MGLIFGQWLQAPGGLLGVFVHVCCADSFSSSRSSDPLEGLGPRPIQKEDSCLRLQTPGKGEIKQHLFDFGGKTKAIVALGTCTRMMVALPPLPPWAGARLQLDEA